MMVSISLRADIYAHGGFHASLWQSTADHALQPVGIYSGRQKSVSKTSPCLAEQFVCDDSSI